MILNVIYVDKCRNMLSVEEWREYRKHIEKMEDILEKRKNNSKKYHALYYEECATSQNSC